MDDNKPNPAEPTTAPLLGKQSMHSNEPKSQLAAAPKSPEPTVVADSPTFANDPIEPKDADTNDSLTEHQARINYLRSLRADKPSHKKRNVSIIAIILLAVAAGAVYWLFFIKTTTESAKPTTVTQTQQSFTDGTDVATTQTKQYTSSVFSVGFTYPADWTVAEGDDAILVISPKRSLTDANGQPADANIMMKIQAKQTSPLAFKSGDATAVLDSEKIDYTNPSSTQRAQTYLSFVQYANTTAKGGLDALYITGNMGYQKAQAIPKSDITKVDPLVIVSFLQCNGSDCRSQNQPPLTIAASSWTDDLQTTVETMLKSLTIE